MWPNVKSNRNPVSQGSKQFLRGSPKSFQDKRYQQFFDKIVEKHKDLFSFGLNVREYHPWKLKTLCHGDPWFNNIMYRWWSAVMHFKQFENKILINPLAPRVKNKIRQPALTDYYWLNF